jgi:hypothetical protein
MSGLFHLRPLPKLNFHRDIDVEEVYRVLDSSKEEERKKSLLSETKAKELADLIIGKGKNTKIFDEIDKEIRDDIHQESLDQKPEKIFNFHKWLWKIGF